MTQDEYAEMLSQAKEQFKQGTPLFGKDGAFHRVLEDFLNSALECEMDSHLYNSKTSTKINRRNGKMSKEVQTEYGPVEIDTPRDREGSFTPEIIKKRQTILAEGLSDKIISLYATGQSMSDISKFLEENYGTKISKETISNITDKVWPEIKTWRTRSLEEVYPIVWMDAIHYKAHDDTGATTSRAIYNVIGVDKEGHKDLLGMYVSHSEGANFWLSVLTDLQNRGVKDILIACVDGLTGFPDAIQSVFPKTDVQLCIVHQIRNSVKYVASKNQKEFLKDLKMVYAAQTKEKAEIELDNLEKKWGKQYPIVIKSWRDKWDNLSHYFDYTEPIRRIMYTTNIVEGYHRQIRKVTKKKGVFPTDEALFKLVYLAYRNIKKKWTQPLRNWGQTAQQFAIKFGDRFQLL
ncbi:transposase [Prevotella scopos JCM 17725]|uniref:IS256 family transposase n=1 Tax=Prevotella scopos TaxID=589437 RepID=UPI00080732FF|nr:IS256 family transposase [Prevotella scopos]ANR72874.1 transposase [Prevotella scopos JCM 17725]